MEKKKKGVLQRYNGAEAKKNVRNTAMKTGVDAVLGTSAGAGLGAAFGIWSPLAGFLMIGAGHYFGDKSGVLRVAGAATIAYGIAKASENRAAAEVASVNGISLGSLAEGAKDRLSNFKDNFLKAYYLDKITGKKKEAVDATVGAIDMSELNAFEDLIKESAVRHELKTIQEEDSIDEDFVEEEEIDEYETEIIDDGELEGMNYALIDEEYDFSTF